MIACPVCLTGLIPPRKDDLSGDHKCRCGRFTFSEIGSMWIFKTRPGLGGERVVVMPNGNAWVSRTGRVQDDDRELAVLNIINLARVNEVMGS